MSSLQEIKELHDRAMSLAEDAFFARRRGDLDLSKRKFQEAFPLEKEAALRTKEEKVGEPSESVLLRSAATIALNAGMYDDAEKLACLALSGEPPGFVADELREVLAGVLAVWKETLAKNKREWEAEDDETAKTGFDALFTRPFVKRFHVVSGEDIFACEEFRQWLDDSVKAATVYEFPDSKLHPDKQLEAAKEIIARHDGDDCPVVIITYSLYFIEAMELFAKDNCALWYVEETGLVDVTEKPEQIYRSLAKAVQALENLRYAE